MRSTTLLRRTRERAMSLLRPRSDPRISSRHRKSESDQAPTADRIMQIAWGYAPPLILEAALNFQLFDRLEKAPQTAADLAAQTGASLRGLVAILNALVGLGFLTKAGDRFGLTPESSAFLVSSKPAYHGDYLRHATRHLIPRWLRLTDSVRTGLPAIAGTPENAGEFFAEFVESLFPLSYRAARTLGEHIELARTSAPATVLDIGAGSGVWGITLAQQSPFIKVVAVDWPLVLEVTKRVARREGIGERLRTVAGDLSDADFGSGHQVAILGNVLHGEGGERSRTLLRKTFGALTPGATIVICEFMPNEERTAPANALLFAVNMLVNTEAGDTFTFNEIAGWLREAGFENPRKLEVPAPSPLVLANKPR
jgi:hypothetical protein